MAAHEIRNPLGVIRGTVDLMRERSATSLSERDLTALGDIGEEVERLRQLTQDLLDLSTDRPLSLAPVAVGDILAEVSHAAESPHSLESAYGRDGDSLPPLEADGARLRQVFTNLLAIAAQAQKEGEVVIFHGPPRARSEHHRRRRRPGSPRGGRSTPLRSLLHDQVWRHRPWSRHRAATRRVPWGRAGLRTESTHRSPVQGYASAAVTLTIRTGKEH